VWGSGLFAERPEISFEPFLDALSSSSFLRESGGYWQTGPFFSIAEKPAAGKDAEGKDFPVAAMDAPFSLALYPEISLADALSLPVFCSLREGPGLSFELDRPSVVRGFDQGLSARDMLETLGRLTGNRLDKNLAWTLSDWEKRYDSVSLHEGLTLVLSEDRRYLADAGPVAALIRKTLAPGVYLLAPGARSDAARSLRKAGVDIFAQPPAELPDRRLPRPRRERIFPALSDGGLQARELLFSRGAEGALDGTPAGKPAEKKGGELSGGEEPRDRFRKMLGKMRLSKNERDELSARIERRLVLCESQLEASSVRYEKLEARGLDYAGKAVIAKQAIAQRAMLELSWPDASGSGAPVTGIPLALEKKGGDAILVLKPQENSRGEGRVQEELRIPLGKISFLRRIKQSIFEE
jgi:hypothetical protein